jgi:toxin secretion/phage lysis holin
MSRFVDWIPVALKWLIASMIAAWFKLSSTIHLLLIMMALDFFTGVVVAVMEGKLDKRASYEGFLRKSMTLLLITMAHLAAAPLNLSIDLGEVMAVGYTFNEIISIIQNCAAAGVPIPAALVENILKLRKMKFMSSTEVQKELGDGSVVTTKTTVNVNKEEVTVEKKTDA